MSIKCLKCGEPQLPDTKICPRCGSRDKLVTVTDSISLIEMLSTKQKAKGFKRFKKLIKQGEKISKSGSLARETLIIDREKGIKEHLVEEKAKDGKWVLVHKEQEPFKRSSLRAIDNLRRLFKSAFGKE